MKNININRIQSVIDEIRYSMHELNARSETFEQMVVDNDSDNYCMAIAKGRCREMIQYIGGLSEALRFIGFSVDFDIRTSNGIHYYDDVKVYI